VAHGLVILNPIAGQGTAASRVPELERLLAERALDYRIVLTERPWHAAELAERAALDGTAAVVAAGGDGTANEVLNGLMLARGKAKVLPAMGILCVGRGNDFAYGAGVPSGLAEGCQTLADGYRRPMDVGLIVGGDYPRGRYFGNGIGVGFDTIVGLEAAKMKNVHGFAAYVFAAFKTLFLYYQAPLLRIERDGGSIETRSIEISVMNGRRMGGTFFMAPGALNDDGFLDLCMADAPSRPAMIALLLKFMKGRQAESPHITTGRVRQMSLTALDGALAIQADGETICIAGASVRVECLAGQVQMICRRPTP
jgi:diacylglycerol kinase (ATP)